MLLICGACSTSSKYTPSGNPLLDLRNPELLTRDRVSAAKTAWGEVEQGIRDRERTRFALKNLAWSGATERDLRLAVLQLLMSDYTDEGSADSRSMARLILPNEKDPEAIRIIALRAIDSGWDDMVPALVRSFARQNPDVPDHGRIEYAALRELRPDETIPQVVFEVFLYPTRGIESEQELSVLRIAQRTRDEAWGLLSRLDPTGESRRHFLDVEIDSLEGLSEDSQKLIEDLQAARRELDVLPDSSMEIGWLQTLRDHPDLRNRDLNQEWWAETSQVVQSLGVEQRNGIEMRHLEPVRWASQNRPAWLKLGRESLYAVLNERLSGRVHHKRKNEKGEPPRKERLGDWFESMPWGDLLTILIIDEAMKNPVVLEQLFIQRELDQKDETTEYGGVVETDSDTGWRAVLFRPRQRDRVSDQRFVASDDMFRFSDRSLAHYHFHADRRSNSQYAGPSITDQLNASNSGRNCMVFTSIDSEAINIDVYFPNGVVVDLGEFVEPTGGG